MILDRYLTREIAKPLIAVSSALAIIFASFMAARYLTQVADGVYPASSVLPLVTLKTVIGLEVLLTIGLHLSVVLALGRLYTHSEMTALSASGVSPARILRVVVWVSLLVALVVAYLSISVRPWAYEMRYRLEQQAVAEFDLNDIEAGRFYQSHSGRRVIFVESLDGDTRRMRGVFIQVQGGGILRVISAKEAYYRETGPDGGGELVCFDAHVYELPGNGEAVLEARIHELRLQLEEQEPLPIGYKRKAAPTLQLAGSDSPMDIAEFQWRLATPLTTLLLGLLGFPLSRAEARQGKYAKLSVAVLIYAAYYNLNLVARTWVEQGVVGPVPGIWWVHAVLGVLLVVLMWQPSWTLRRRRHGSRS